MTMNRTTHNPSTASLQDGARGQQRRRARLLGATSVLAFAGLLGVIGAAPALAAPPPAQGALVTVDSSGALTAQGFVTLIAGQINVTATNSISIDAELSGITGGQSIIGTPGALTPITGAVTSNTIGAYATGNTAANAADLKTIGDSYITAAQIDSDAGTGAWNVGGTVLTTTGTTLLEFASSADAAAFVADISSHTATVTQAGADVTVGAGVIDFTNALGGPLQGWSWTGSSSGGSVDVGGGNGIAMLISSANTPSGTLPTTITSSVTGSSLANGQTDVPTNSALTLTDNLITAQTTGNTASSSVSGKVPSGYAGAGLGGNISLNPLSTTLPLSASGDIAVGTNQFNDSVSQDWGSGAALLGDTIAVTVNSSAGSTPEILALSSTQTGNTLSAIFTGNSATTSVSAASGDATTLTGSIAVANQQLNTTSLGFDPIDVAATNLGSLVITSVVSGSGNNPITLSGGTITQADNTISSSATGNSAVGVGAGVYGNSIELAGGLSLQGNVTAPVNVTVVPASSASRSDLTRVVADLALANVQENQLTPLDSLTQDGGIVTVVQNATGGTISLGDNAITASAIGNNASNAILAPSASDAPTALIWGAIALANSQINIGSPISATVDTNTVSATVGVDGAGAPSGDATVTGAAVSVAGSSIAASAYGSEAANTLSVAADTVTAPTGQEVLTLARRGGLVAGAVAIAGLSVNNFQYSFESVATATNTDSAIALTANSAALEGGGLNDTLSISGVSGAPTIDAVAVSNSSTNGLYVSATTLTGSAGLVNAQDDQTGARATLTNPSIALTVNTVGEVPAAVTGSNLTVGASLDGLAGVGNTLRAIAYGNQAANGLSVSATTLNNPLVDSPPGSIVRGLHPVVLAGFGLLNYQSESESAPPGSVTAEADAAAAPVSITIGNGGVSDSTVANAGNGLVTAAYGNQATNIGGINATNLPQLYFDSANYSPLANVTSVQSVTADVTATVYGPKTGSLFTTSVGTGGATGSTLGVSNNTVLTQAEGNQAGNGLAVSGGDLADASSTPLGGLTSTGATGVNIADLAFTVQNVQYANPSAVTTIAATQTGTGALLAFGGSVSGSAAQANGNQFLATAYANTAYSGLALGSADAPITTLAASGGAQNVQMSIGSTEASLGTAGALIGAVPYSVISGDNEATIYGSTLTVTGNALVFDVSGLSTSQLTAFETLVPGGTYDGTAKTWTLVPGTYTLANPSAFLTSGGLLYQTTLAAVSKSTSYLSLSDSPAVQITVAGNIVNSTLGVNNNVANATAVANNATNLTLVNATTLSASAGLGNNGASGSVTTTTVTVLADYAVSNNQSSTGGTTATAFGEASLVDSQTNPTITGSALSVSNNTQAAQAEANVGSTTLTVTATANNFGATGALVSYQSGTGSVTASSGNPIDDEITPTVGQTVQAPGAITNSSLTMSGNSNGALAVMNDATNTVTASGANLLTGNASPTNATAAVTGGGNTTVVSATADFSLTNVQSASSITTGVSATASTQVLNSDSTALTTSGLIDSSATLNNNATSAKAYSNRADNALTLTGTNVTATGALTNSQTNAAGVNADAASVVAFSLNGSPADGSSAPAASGSSISVSSNTLQAQAVANQATNALNATPSASYGSQPITGSVSNNSPSASASYALLNDQSNSGPVSATGDAGSNFGVALNGGTGAAPVNGSTITVQNNALNVGAFGNSANNTVTLTALNTGNAAAALDSVQNNTGSVTALATNAVFGVSIGLPGAIGSTISVANNSVTAHAVGNAVSNAVIAR
jgi:hypothetical protein